MPAVLAIPAFWAAVGTGAAASGSVYAANKVSNSADNAANITAKSSADALDFTKQKAEQDQANFIKTQQANYDLYRAQQARLAPYQAMGASAQARLGSGLGLKPSALPTLPNAPDYTMFSGTDSSAKPQTTAPRSPYSPQTNTVSDLVMYKMRAPNGDVQTVPSSMKDYWLQKGATVVS